MEELLNLITYARCNRVPARLTIDVDSEGLIRIEASIVQDDQKHAFGYRMHADILALATAPRDMLALELARVAKSVLVRASHPRAKEG